MNENQNGYNPGGNQNGGWGYNQSPYNNNPYNNSGYGYNPPPYGYRPVRQESPKLIREREGIRSISKWSGMGVLGAFVVSFILSAVGDISSVAAASAESELFKYGFQIVTSLLFIGLPFLICGLAMRKRENFALPYGAPRNKKDFFLLLGIAVAGSFAANYIVAIVSLILNGAGIEMTSPTYTLPATAGGTILYVIKISVVPALTEEFAFRGVIMQPLRKYGDKFAIVMSALVFALMHGNAVQGLFAFMIGILIGYCVVVTGSMWTGVAIHFVNNFISVIFDLVRNGVSTEAFSFIYGCYSVIVVALGAICLLLYFSGKERIRIPVSCTELTTRQKTKTFLTTAPVVISVIFMVITTLASFNIT